MHIANLIDFQATSDMDMRSAMVDVVLMVVEIFPSAIRMYLCKEADSLNEVK